MSIAFVPQPRLLQPRRPAAAPIAVTLEWRSPESAARDGVNSPLDDRAILTVAYSEQSRILVDVRQLRYFKYIADHGSLSQAAFRLNVVQSTLSHNLAQIEEELGVELFLRRPRGVELTEAGKKLYDYVSEVLEVLNTARQDVAATAQSFSDHIWIGLNHTATNMLSPQLLTTLIERHADLRLGLIEDLSGTLIEHLVDGDIDVAVVFNPPDDARIQSTPLFRESICCVGLPALLEESNEPIEFSRVEALPLLLAGQGSNLRGIVENESLARRLKDSCVAEITSLTAMVKALEAGVGCTLLAASTVQEYLDTGELVARRIVGPEISHELHVSYLNGSDKASLLDAVVEVVRHQIDLVMQGGRYDLQPI